MHDWCFDSRLANPRRLSAALLTARTYRLRHAIVGLVRRLSGLERGSAKRTQIWRGVIIAT
jgi:hypothetical protein